MHGAQGDARIRASVQSPIQQLWIESHAGLIGYLMANIREAAMVCCHCSLRSHA